MGEWWGGKILGISVGGWGGERGRRLKEMGLYSLEMVCRVLAVVCWRR